MSDRRQSEHDGRVVAVNQDDIGTGPVGVPIRDRLLVHEMQLANGQKAFIELRESVKELAGKQAATEAKMQPKPTNWMAVGGFAFTVLMVVLTSIWTLNTLFSDRPTRAELREGAAEQKKATADQADDLREVREKQTEQRVILDGVREEVRDTSRKLDILIQNDKAAAPRGR